MTRTLLCAAALMLALLHPRGYAAPSSQAPPINLQQIMSNVAGSYGVPILPISSGPITVPNPNGPPPKPLSIYKSGTNSIKINTDKVIKDLELTEANNQYFVLASLVLHEALHSIYGCPGPNSECCHSAIWATSLNMLCAEIAAAQQSGAPSSTYEQACAAHATLAPYSMPADPSCVPPPVPPGSPPGTPPLDTPPAEPCEACGP